jgi:opacity protein-like surface antigen
LRVFLAIALSLQAFTLLAQPYSRTGLREYSLQPFLLEADSYEFEEGAQAKIDGGYGIGLGFNWHLNNYLALGVDFSLSETDYRARVTRPGGALARDTTGSLERGTARVHATWHLLAGRTTPLLTAGLGFTYLDPELDDAPAAGGCLNYPFWGRFCGAEPPTHGITRFTYALGAGLRHDFVDKSGFVRFVVSGEWIDWNGTPERLEALELRVDFGARY